MLKQENLKNLSKMGWTKATTMSSLSPDGNYISITDMRKKPPKFIIMETTNLQEIAEKEINVTLDPRDYGVFAGNIIWTRTMEDIVFLVQSTSSLSSILYYDIETKTITTIVEKDPTFVELLFIDENNHVALSKTTYYPFSKSYWYLDLARKEFIPIATATPES